ncbi:hypothetical protein [Pseudomonas sp. CMR5c]|uniref:hypothetical protein n=1 Tax=Pseudomonas sp. CMR5c TaxID=658630 RepID=UPI000F579798|nr:hypothetical protein [Pseudomonas sp. CMR5c]
MQSIETTLCAYSEQHLPALPHTYAWKFDAAIVHESFGLTVAGANWYERARTLKRGLSGQWALFPEKRTDIANYAVKTWGGVGANLATTMQGYVQAVSEGGVPATHKGIASWSKVAAFSDPGLHAIFDARVSFSLNAIQLLQGRGQHCWFPHLPGRNNLLNGCWPRLKVMARQQGWLRIGTRQVYARYIELITNVAGQLGVDIDDIEMLLFSKAGELAHEFNLAYPHAHQ